MIYRCLRCSSVLDVPAPLHVDTVLRCESRLPVETGRVFADGMREVVPGPVPCNARHIIHPGPDGKGDALQLTDLQDHDMATCHPERLVHTGGLCYPCDLARSAASKVTGSTSSH